ncbi:unnamed protein product, partial [Vitis vinifera]
MVQTSSYIFKGPSFDRSHSPHSLEFFSPICPYFTCSLLTMTFLNHDQPDL